MFYTGGTMDLVTRAIFLRTYHYELKSMVLISALLAKA